MNTDQQLLERVHREAARRIRRRRTALSAAVVVAILGVSAAAAALTTRDERDRIVTVAPEVTTSTATSTTSTSTSTTAATTSTSTATTTTTSTTVPTTTTIPPIAPVTGTNQTGGVKATVTASQDRARPGMVELTIRIEDGHGSHPTGYVLWDGSAYTLWGDGSIEDGSGEIPGWLFSECDEVMDEDPATNLGPDPAATATDRTHVLHHDYGSTTGDTSIKVAVYTSLCSTDQESTPVELVVPIS